MPQLRRRATQDHDAAQAVPANLQEQDAATEKAAELMTAACVLVERYGLDGNEPRSLAVVAAKYGFDRQTVRTIETRILVALKRAFENRGKREAP